MYGYAGLLAYSLWDQLNVIINEESGNYKPTIRNNASKKVLPPRGKRKRNSDETREGQIEVGKYYKYIVYIKI